MTGDLGELADLIRIREVARGDCERFIRLLRLVGDRRVELMAVSKAIAEQQAQLDQDKLRTEQKIALLDWRVDVAQEEGKSRGLGALEDGLASILEEVEASIQNNNATVQRVVDLDNSRFLANSIELRDLEATQHTALDVARSLDRKWFHIVEGDSAFVLEVESEQVYFNLCTEIDRAWRAAVGPDIPGPEVPSNLEVRSLKEPSLGSPQVVSGSPRPTTVTLPAPATPSAAANGPSTSGPSDLAPSPAPRSKPHATTPRATASGLPRKTNAAVPPTASPGADPPSSRGPKVAGPPKISGVYDWDHGELTPNQADRLRDNATYTEETQVSLDFGGSDSTRK